MLDAIAREPKDRALYLYPTKALAQDQARALGELRAPNVRAAIYDGDTPGGAALADPPLGERDPHEPGHAPRRRAARTTTAGRTCCTTSATSSSTRRTSTAASSARTSPTSSAGCAGSRGVYGAEPQLLFASATIANPGELAAALGGIEATVVDRDAAPRAERTIALWNPELLDAELGLRASPLGEASRLMAALVSRGLRTICFAKSRKAAELIHKFTVDRVDADDGQAARAVPRRLHAGAAA